MTDVKNPSDSTSKNQQDNLQQIHGVGFETANALNRIGIWRFSDLARCTPESLSDDLYDQANFRVAAKQIKNDDWINQAKELAEREHEDHNQVHEKVPHEVEVIKESSVTRASEDIAEPEHWQKYASFTVLFETKILDQQAKIWQTRVLHHESKEEAKLHGTATVPWLIWMLDQVTKIWQTHTLHHELKEEAKSPKTDTLPWMSWMSEQSRVSMPSTLVPAASQLAQPNVPEHLNITRLEILDFKLTESEEASRYLRCEKKLSADFLVRLIGNGAKDLIDNQNLFQVAIYIFDLKEKSSQLVASQEDNLQPNQFEYKIHQEFLMPNPGNYECYSVALLLPPHPLISYQRQQFNVT